MIVNTDDWVILPYLPYNNTRYIIYISGWISTRLHTSCDSISFYQIVININTERASSVINGCYVWISKVLTMESCLTFAVLSTFNLWLPVLHFWIIVFCPFNRWLYQVMFMIWYNICVYDFVCKMLAPIIWIQLQPITYRFVCIGMRR